MNARHDSMALVERLRWFGFAASVTGATVAGVLAFSASTPPSTNAFTERPAATVAVAEHEHVVGGRGTRQRPASLPVGRRQAAARRHADPGRTHGTGTEDRQDASPRHDAQGTKTTDAGGGPGQHRP